jgi:CheY-like chemotaxis protein
MQSESERLVGPVPSRDELMKSTEPVNILVVDDMPEKILAVEATLAELGQNIVKATSGREALRSLLKDDFAVILLDVNMPEMDGFETAALIRERRRSEHTPIIFVTAFNDDVQMAKGYSLGAVDFISTPLDPDVLRTKVGVFVELFQKTETIRQQAAHRVQLAREQPHLRVYTAQWCPRWRMDASSCCTTPTWSCGFPTFKLNRPAQHQRHRARTRASNKLIQSSRRPLATRSRAAMRSRSRQMQ